HRYAAAGAARPPGTVAAPGRAVRPTGTAPAGPRRALGPPGTRRRGGVPFVDPGPPAAPPDLAGTARRSRPGRGTAAVRAGSVTPAGAAGTRRRSRCNRGAPPAPRPRGPAA